MSIVVRIDAPSNEVFAWHCRMALLKDLIHDGGDILLLKGEKERKGSIIVVMVVRYYSNALS